MGSNDKIWCKEVMQFIFDNIVFNHVLISPIFPNAILKKNLRWPVLRHMILITGVPHSALFSSVNI